MAKETTIIFVYDTKMLQKEEDDPATAILYFHPTWVSDQQKTALCGQILGTIQCLKNIFSIPKMVSLQSGKFFIIENGKYLLAVGTDRNIADWVLQNRAEALYSLINFFHKDFLMLSQIYQNESLSAKLYHIFETYLKMLFFGGNIFSHIPSLSLPKSASNVFTEAVIILECCQEFYHVLGGSLLYHNKVVATQLSSDLTKRLILSDPYRIKCPAEIAEVNFDLPLGVQLLQVYITNKEYCTLLETSLRNRSIFQYLYNKSIKKPQTKSFSQITETPIVSAMKRDQSLLFTTVPEEGTDHSILSTEPSFVPTQKKTRPKFLNLRSLSIDSVETKPNKTAPMTPFCGQTSVVSTPMTELKKFVHQNPLSIVVDNKNEENEKCDTCESPVKFKKSNRYNDVGETFYDNRRHSSLTDITEIANSISKNPDQYFNLKNKIDLSLSPQKKQPHNIYKTIADPTFPIFKSDGTIISYLYYKDYVKITTELIESQLNKEKTFNSIHPKQNSLATFDLDIKNKETRSVNEQRLPSLSNRCNRDHRKSLNLPLKSLSTTDSLSECGKNDQLNRRFSSGVQLTPLMSKLSMLAFEERSSGFCSREGTPCDYRGFTPTQQNFTFPYTKLKAKDVKNNKSEDDNILQKCILFVCGQQDVVLALLMKEECCKDQDTIEKLWELCTENLGKLEKQLNFCIESQTGGSSHESEPYSYLCLDSEWDTTKRGGPWGTNDLTSLVSLHQDFKENNKLTEILLRGNDSVTYGYNCGPTEVFYHESVGITSGLPTPADPMGLVQLKAKRRLERDHAILLL